jgi:aminoglycoside phosphotransferase (APT) family kinase protein
MPIGQDSKERTLQIAELSHAPGRQRMDNLHLIGKGRLAEVFAWGDTQVLKLFAVGRDYAAIEAEARVSQIVHEAGVVTPGTHGVVKVEGRQGIVYDRALGVSMLGLLSAKPWKLFEFGRTLAELHVSVHQCSADDLPSQREQLARLIARAELPTAQRDLALARLREQPEGTAICHGDFHPDNVLIDGDAATVIDWTTACVGNPTADFALTSLILDLGDPPPDASLWTRISIRVGRTLFSHAYTSRYRRLSYLSQQDVQPWALPIAVARLGYAITAERDQLLKLIDKATKHKSLRASD